MFKSDPPKPREFQKDRIFDETMQGLLTRIENLEKRIAILEKKYETQAPATSEMEDMMFDEEGNPVFF